MKANRKVMLGAALVVAVIALAGVGYAAVTGYTATTSTGNNSVGDSQYLIVKPGTDYTGKFTGNYAYNTQNDAGTLKWIACMEIEGDTLGSAETYKKVNIVDSTFTIVTEGDYTYDAVSVGTETIIVDATHSENKNVTLTITPTAGYTQGTLASGVSLVITCKIGTGAEKVLNLTSAATTEVFDASVAANTVTINAYLLVPHAGVAVGSVTDSGKMVDVTLSYLAAAAASA